MVRGDTRDRSCHPWRVAGGQMTRADAPTRQATIRRALGFRVIALGRRLVGEPPLELARSR
jgi:hypothetical protein